MMHIPRSVLVAVDFGDASARAVAIGGLISERCPAATLRLLHSESVEAPVYFTSGQVERLERERHMLQAQAEELLTRFGRQHTTTPFSASVDIMSPVDAILRQSTASDFVVMGTHGRHGPKKWWLGSVAERVLREIMRPLLIVRAEKNRPVASLFDRALVHSAPPLASAATLQYARDLAACVGGAVVDQGHGQVEHLIEQTGATIVIAALPQLRSAAWLSNVGEPLVRTCQVPILFVPDRAPGGMK